MLKFAIVFEEFKRGGRHPFDRTVACQLLSMSYLMEREKFMKNTSVRTLGFSLLVTATLLTSASAQPTCADPKLAATLQTIAERTNQVAHGKELNGALLHERGSNLTSVKGLTYASSALAVVGVTVAGVAVGAAAGATVGFIGLNEAAGAAGLVVHEAQVTQAAITFGGGAILGGIAGAGGSALGLAYSPGGSDEAITSEATARMQELPGVGPISSEVLVINAADFIERFRTAHREIGKTAMMQEQMNTADARWYHLGWDEKRDIEIMVAENQAHYQMYSMEQDLLKTLKDATLAACATITPPVQKTAADAAIKSVSADSVTLANRAKSAGKTQTH